MLTFLNIVLGLIFQLYTLTNGKLLQIIRLKATKSAHGIVKCFTLSAFSLSMHMWSNSVMWWFWLVYNKSYHNVHATWMVLFRKWDNDKSTFPLCPCFVSLKPRSLLLLLSSSLKSCGPLSPSLSCIKTTVRPFYKCPPFLTCQSFRHFETICTLSAIPGNVI